MSQRTSKYRIVKRTKVCQWECGICEQTEWRKKASVECPCGQHVHVACLKLTVKEAYNRWLNKQIQCQCTSSRKRQATSNADANEPTDKKRRRKTVALVEATNVAVVTCVAVLTAILRERAEMRPGRYVMLHGPQKKELLGPEERTDWADTCAPRTTGRSSHPR